MRAALVAAALAIAACRAPDSANPAERCSEDGKCPKDTHCYRGFCIPDEGEAAESGDAGRDGEERES